MPNFSRISRAQIFSDGGLPKRGPQKKVAPASLEFTVGFSGIEDWSNEQLISQREQNIESRNENPSTIRRNAVRKVHIDSNPKWEDYTTDKNNDGIAEKPCRIAVIE